MNIKTGNGMGIKPTGMQLKPSNGMGIKTSNGMGITTSKGMGLSTDKNYFKFNEYERKRRYLFGDRGRGNNNKKPAPKPQEKKPAEKPKPVEKKPEPKKEEQPPEPKKENPVVVPPLPLAETPKPSGDPPTTRLPPIEPTPALPGNSVGSMQRMMKLFG